MEWDGEIELTGNDGGMTGNNGDENIIKLFLLIVLSYIKGTVRVYYEVKVGSLTPLSTNLLAAIPMSDFVPVVADYVVVDPGEASSTIPVQLYDDDIPEVDEVLLVNITGVILEEPINSGFTPKLGKSIFLSLIKFSPRIIIRTP